MLKFFSGTLFAAALVVTGEIARAESTLPPSNRAPGEGSTNIDQSSSGSEAAPAPGGKTDAIETDARGNQTVSPEHATTHKAPMLSDRGDEGDRIDRAAKASSSEASDGETDAERATNSSGSMSAGSSAAGKSGLESPREASAGSKTQPEDKEPAATAR